MKEAILQEISMSLIDLRDALENMDTNVCNHLDAVIEAMPTAESPTGAEAQIRGLARQIVEWAARVKVPAFNPYSLDFVHEAQVILGMRDPG